MIDAEFDGIETESTDKANIRYNDVKSNGNFSYFLADEEMINDGLKVPKMFHEYIAGAVSGCAGMVVGHPLDTIKVQLQTQASHNKYDSLKSCFQSVKNQSLSKGFYRGLSWPLLSYGAINSVYFGVYQKSLTWLSGHGICSKNSHVNMLIAGSMGGAAQLVIACPIDVIKVVLQSQIPHNRDNTLKKYYKGPVTAFRDILRVRGIAGLYRGIGTQLIRDIPSSGVYFFSFEYLRSHLSTFVSPDSKLVSLLAGGTAGVISWLLILPLDVVKSRLQADTERKLFTGFLNCVVKSYREDGFKVFFRGGSMVSVRAFPVNAVIFMTYFECMKYLE